MTYPLPVPFLSGEVLLRRAPEMLLEPSGYGFAGPIAPEGRGAFQRATSRVLEIDPVTLQCVWSYTNPRFFSTNISGA